jgi:UDP-N-acetylglucosamine diphosphorylase/glucosamine-1-phosphate N-acetyltransferase
MNSDLPKVLHPLQGKPLIQHVISNLEEAGVENIVVVVGYKGDRVVEILHPGLRHVWQREQLGTGHAVMQAEKALSGFRGRIIVACGDAPLMRSGTFRRLIAETGDEKVKAVVLTMDVQNPRGYGRIIRNSEGSFLKIVEEKDASPEQRLINEVNTGTYIFDRDFLFEGLGKIDRNNAQGEFYLTDVLYYIINSGFKVKPLLLEDPIEGSGINTQEELLKLEELLKNQG